MSLAKNVMSGMRPTGALHLGHWMGALKSWLELQHNHQCYFSIVDWHALTTDYEKSSEINENIRVILLDWLSAGIDPQKSVIYKQSDIKEIAEMYLLWSMFTPLGWLERVPTFKEQQQQLADRDINTVGFLGYPLLQTVDIAIMQAELVPVGEDQVVHIELAREIVRRFNFIYQQNFPEPQAFLTPLARIPGTDGRKMSKSYNNAIFLSDSPETVAEKIKPMMTDVRRKRRSDPGVPQDCPVYYLHQAFSAPEEIAEISVGCTKAAIGCLDCKKIVIKNINQFLLPFHQRRAEFASIDLNEILVAGARKAGLRAKETLRIVREAMKI